MVSQQRRCIISLGPLNSLGKFYSQIFTAKNTAYPSREAEVDEAKIMIQIEANF